MKATTLAIKSTIEQRFNIRGIALDASLGSIGLSHEDLQPLQIRLKDSFGHLIAVEITDSIDTIYDKINHCNKPLLT